jgi:hypothetical protein
MAFYHTHIHVGWIYTNVYKKWEAIKWESIKTILTKTKTKKKHEIKESCPVLEMSTSSDFYKHLFLI